MNKNFKSFFVLIFVVLFLVGYPLIAVSAEEDTGGDTGGDTSGDTGSGDTGGDTSGDTGSGDTGGDTSGDTGSGDTGGDTGTGDTGDDTGGDTGSGDTGDDTGGDTGTDDTGSGDTGDDTGGDTGTDDTGSGDTGDDTGEDKCAGVECSPTKTTCSDGSEVSCGNSCDSSTGSCSSCSPSCPTEPGVPGSGPVCHLECGECETLASDGCYCKWIDGCERGSGTGGTGWDCSNVQCGECEKLVTPDCRCEWIEGCEKSIQCPNYKTCPDGADVSCWVEHKDDGQRCECESCPLPENCRRETDEYGMERVECERKDHPDDDCKPIDEEGIRKECFEKGGEPVERYTRPMKCLYIDCEFRNKKDKFFENEDCPDDEEMQEVKEKCWSMKQKDMIIFEHGCKFVKCVDENWHEERSERGFGEDCVRAPPRHVVEEKEMYCGEMGKIAIMYFDNDGCQYIDCASSEQEKTRDPPMITYEKCERTGGKMVVRRDENGYVDFAECIMRGDRNEVYVDEMDRIPESHELLDMAFKLEELKMTFDRLSKKTADIANYYAQSGSWEADRFRSVSGMFESAKGKVDEIKEKLKNRLQDLNIDDMMEIRQDLRYIKDVLLKDIVYFMLGSEKDVREFVVEDERDENDCGRDGMCFDNAFRTCTPGVLFYPEGKPRPGQEPSPTLRIDGVEDGKCKLYVFVETPFGKMDMTCRMPDYSFGMRNPEEMFPHCQGPLLAEAMKRTENEPSYDDYREPPRMEPFEREFERDFDSGCELTIEDVKRKKDGCMQDGGNPIEEHDSKGCPYVNCKYEDSGTKEPCSGCLDNDVCDPGECSDCRDCL
ncbi:MAG: hypothetical protein ISS36_02715 [Candidatus Aenigmarchaeota archaeon]|nr:hypothetical protein [Candidatus Aenigmarchaeota archaeon]